MKRKLPAEFAPGTVVGIIGAGKFGTALKTAAEAEGCSVLLCDPPRAAQESADVREGILEQWGNGMGGCCATTDVFDEPVFLPQDYLLKQADVLVLAVPPGVCIVTEDFLRKLRPDSVVLNCSDPVETTDTRILNCQIQPFTEGEE